MSHPPKCYTCGLLVGKVRAGWVCPRPACTNPLLGAETARANEAVRRARSDKQARARGKKQKRDLGRAKAYQRDYYQAHKPRYQEVERRLRAKLAYRIRRAERWRKRYHEDAEFRARTLERAADYRQRQLAAGKVFKPGLDGFRHWVQLGENP
jgi:hypothetical protein